MVLLVLLLAVLPSDSVANPQVIAVQIEKTRSGGVVLVTRGSSTAGLGAGGFAASTKVVRIPCPGRYRFEAESEDLRTGALTAYSAELVLSTFSSYPLGTPCGSTIPSVGGKASVVLSGGGSPNPLHLTGHRSGHGNFVGKLQVSAFPSCRTVYELRSDFSLHNWKQTFTFEARFEQAELSYPGNVSTPTGCED
jgi:hypothetical protein